MKYHPREVSIIISVYTIQVLLSHENNEVTLLYILYYSASITFQQNFLKILNKMGTTSTNGQQNVNDVVISSCTKEDKKSAI